MKKLIAIMIMLAFTVLTGCTPTEIHISNGTNPAETTSATEREAVEPKKVTTIRVDRETESEKVAEGAEVITYSSDSVSAPEGDEDSDYTVFNWVKGAENPPMYYYEGKLYLIFKNGEKVTLNAKSKEIDGLIDTISETCTDAELVDGVYSLNGSKIYSIDDASVTIYPNNDDNIIYGFKEGTTLTEVLGWFRVYGFIGRTAEEIGYKSTYVFDDVTIVDIYSDEDDIVTKIQITQVSLDREIEE